MRAVLFARTAFSDFLRTVEGDDREHGGVFLGPKDGGVSHFVAAPESAMRTATSVTLDGGYFESALRKLRQSAPSLEFRGFGHAHLGHPRELSAGDHAQLNRLHSAGQLPAGGVLVILAVRFAAARTVVRGWQSSGVNVLEEVALAEVEDAHAVAAPASITPMVPGHQLATDAGSRRFALELGDLERRGFTASATVEDRSVALLVAHRERAGRLKVDIAAEGWDRMPRVSTIDESEKRTLVIGGLAPLGSVWSSAWSIADLVDFVVERKLWKRAPSPASAPVSEGEDIEGSS